ncbi:hypothetical protein WJX84_009240, partial [Apatococcus fuscideae]
MLLSGVPASSRSCPLYSADKPQALPWSKRRGPDRIRREAPPANAAAQQDTGAAFILDGQGRKLPFPAVEWQTNSRAYAAFAKGPKQPASPFKLTMGLEPLRKDDWFEIDAAYQEEMRYKSQLLETRREQVVGAMDCPQAKAACQETLEELAEFLPVRFPDMFRRSGSRIANLITGGDWDLADPNLDSLEACSRLIQEDLCLMAKVEGKLR